MTAGGYRLSARSRARLQGVHPDLVRVVERAIELTPVDFQVGEGLRTLARQRQLRKAGASQTLRSRHLTGHAVDLIALIDGKPAWDWPLYDGIAEAMRRAALALSIQLEWGAAWGHFITEYASASAAKLAYIDVRRRAGKSPFLDGPHYQLPWDRYPPRASAA